MADVGKIMWKVEIEVDICKGCGICAIVCPKNVLEMSTDLMNSKGYYPVSVVKMQDCIGCTSCALMCPDSVISIMKDGRG